MVNLSELPKLLLPWYQKNARSMPWRENPQPYYTWISEIMLQQTRVEAATDYFLRFIKALPSVLDLAAVSDEELMKLWEGLGYYSRARNLKKAAEIICRDYGGMLPADYHALRSLPGIGSYTAGAIASIAFELPYPAVDGNVLRVVSRVSDCRADISDSTVKKEWEQIIASILPSQNIGDFNQSLMELGALICQPNGAPRCLNCPLMQICKGFEKKSAEKLPVKAPKKERKTERLSVFIPVADGKVGLSKRGERGLLAGLWELPNISKKVTATDIKRHFNDRGISAIVESAGSAKHVFTHIEWKMEGYIIRLKDSSVAKNLTWCTKEELETRYSLPSAFKKYRQLLLDKILDESIAANMPDRA